jgi:hypothetical protein
MMHRTLIVTCDARDAMPFLRGLPDGEREQVKLIVTPHLAEALWEQEVAGEVHITAGVSTLDRVRRVVGSSPQPVSIVIGPDPVSPLRCKGLIRARLLAPWALDRTARADLVEIASGGRVDRTSAGLTRGALLRTIYVREGLQLVGYVLRGVVDRPEALFRAGVVIPMSVITLARVLPFIAWTETRARFDAPRS